MITTTITPFAPARKRLREYMAHYCQEFGRRSPSVHNRRARKVHCHVCSSPIPGEFKESSRDMLHRYQSIPTISSSSHRELWYTIIGGSEGVKNNHADISSSANVTATTLPVGTYSPQLAPIQARAPVPTNVAKGTYPDSMPRTYGINRRPAPPILELPCAGGSDSVVWYNGLRLCEDGAKLGFLP